MDSPRIQRALISVSDKLGLADFARGLVAAGVADFQHRRNPKTPRKRGHSPSATSPSTPAFPK